MRQTLESEIAWANAVVSGPLQGAHYHYVQGMRTAIQAIFDKWEASGRDAYYSDTLVFPMGLLCRHLVELQLKELARWLDLEDEVIAKGHSLLRIWQRLRPSMESRWPGSNTSNAERYRHLSPSVRTELGIKMFKQGRLDRLDRLINALHQVDPDGVSFRYPGTIPANVRHLGVDKLAQVAREASDELEGFMTAVYEEDVAQAEIQEEFRDYPDDY